MQREAGRREAARPGKRTIDVLRLQSIAVSEPQRGRRRIDEKGKQKGAHELRVGGPEAFPGVTAFKGENVDEDGLGSAKQDVVGRRVLQSPVMRKTLLGQIEGEKSSGGQHFRRPFGRKAWECDAFMLQETIIRGKL